MSNKNDQIDYADSKYRNRNTPLIPPTQPTSIFVCLNNVY